MQVLRFTNTFEGNSIYSPLTVIQEILKINPYFILINKHLHVMNKICVKDSMTTIHLFCSLKEGFAILKYPQW